MKHLGWEEFQIQDWSSYYFLFITGFKRDDPSTYGNYKTFPSDLKNAQNFGLLPTDLRQKVNSVAPKLNLPVAEALQKSFVENDAVFHKKCISKYGPKLKRKLEEHSDIQVIGKWTFTIFWIFILACAMVRVERM